jgi:hypothetical protein
LRFPLTDWFINRRINKHTQQAEYLTKWEHWGPSHQTWLPVSELEGAQRLRQEYDELHPPTKVNRKFDIQRDGPFQTLEKISNNAYCLDLPEAKRIHPVINVSQLEPLPAGKDFFKKRIMPKAGDVLEEDDEDPEYIVSRFRFVPVFTPDFLQMQSPVFLFTVMSFLFMIIIYVPFGSTKSIRTP